MTFLTTADELKGFYLGASEVRCHADDGGPCIDCGGEGIYSKLFPQQAHTMAIDLFERNRSRAQGILCVSTRCANHLRKCWADLEQTPHPWPIVAIEELL